MQNREKAGAKYVVSEDATKSFIPNPEELLKMTIAEVSAELIGHILEKTPSTIAGGYELRIEVVPVDE